MQKPTIVLVIIAVLAVIAGALYLPQLIDEPDAPVMHWDASDEVDGSQDEPEAVSVEAGSVERTAAEISPVAPVRNDQPRIQAILRLSLIHI